MKIAILLTSILLAACNADHSSKTQSKDCSMNGEKVDCRVFSKVEGAKESVQIKAEITAAAEISDTQVEILENAEDSVKQNGKLFPSSPSDCQAFSGICKILFVQSQLSQ